MAVNTTKKEPLFFSGNFNVNERICFLRGAHFFAEKRNVIRVSISTSARASLYAFYRKIKTHLSWGLIEFLAVSALEKRCGWGFGDICLANISSLLTIASNFVFVPAKKFIKRHHKLPSSQSHKDAKRHSL